MDVLPTGSEQWRGEETIKEGLFFRRGLSMLVLPRMEGELRKKKEKEKKNSLYSKYSVQMAKSACRIICNGNFEACGTDLGAGIDFCVIQVPRSAVARGEPVYTHIHTTSGIEQQAQSQRTMAVPVQS